MKDNEIYTFKVRGEVEIEFTCGTPYEYELPVANKTGEPIFTWKGDKAVYPEDFNSDL